MSSILRRKNALVGLVICSSQDSSKISRKEILIARVKRFSPEELAQRIKEFDQTICTEEFLKELKPILPSPEQVCSVRLRCYWVIYREMQIGKLNVYRNAQPAELAELHPSDRLMVQLIQVDRVAARIEGMLFKRTFEERWGLLDDVSVIVCTTSLTTIESMNRVQRSFPKQLLPSLTPRTSRNCWVYVNTN